MNRILIFGNSASGKSTLAKELSATLKLAHFDLDTIGWYATDPPSRKPVSESMEVLGKFIAENDEWVIEGCYTDLLEAVQTFATEIFFLNLSKEQCIENAKRRPWEPHKYSSKQAQDKNLNMLIEWIKDYYDRDDVFSYKAHLNFYESFQGKKKMFIDNFNSRLS